MSLRATIALAVLIGVIGCGSPSDRRDGSLRIRLSGAPAAADTVEVTIRTGGRRFSSRVPRPSDDVITTFDAVPIGEAKIDLTLLAGDRQLATLRDLVIDIVEHEARELLALFSGTPEAVISGAADGQMHLVSAGMIELIITARDPAIAVDVTVTANDRDVAVEDRGMGVFAASIDPRVAGASLPAVIAVEIAVCVRGDAGSCSRSSRSITVHRTVWSKQLGSVSRARPSFDGSQAVFGDRLGLLHFLRAADGEDERAPIQLAPPLSTEPAIADDLVIVTDGAGVVHAISLATGREEWSAAVGAETAPIFDGERLVLGAGRKILALDHQRMGISRELAELPDRVVAAPLADDRGAAAVDASGNVIVLDAADLPVFTATVAGLVRAPPIRDTDGLGVVIATESGCVFRFDRQGAQNGAAIFLDAPIQHRPVIAGADLVVAAGPFLAFIDRAGSTKIERFAVPINGGPDTWSDRAVVLGLRSGVVLVVERDGTKKQLARLSATALSPLVLEAPRRVLIGGSTGEVQMLVAEEGF